jgi:hypothetical protein
MAASNQRFVPTAEQRRYVELLLIAGYAQPAICAVLLNPQTGKPITGKTFRAAFATEIRLAHAQAVSAILDRLIKTAKGRGPQALTAAIFFLKTRAGFREVSRHEIAGDRANPLTLEHAASDPEAVRRFAAEAIAAYAGRRPADG